LGRSPDLRSIGLALLLAAPVVLAEPTTPPVLANLPVQTLEGRPARLDQYASRVTVVALWAYWCKPCLAELPMLDALHRKHQGDGTVTVVAVNIDPPAAAERARATAAALHLSLPVVLDSDGQVRRRINGLLGQADTAPLSLPQTMVLGLQGRGSTERGFPVGISEADFIAAKERLIEQVLGAANAPAAVPTRLGLSVVEGRFRISTPRMSAAQIDTDRAFVENFLRLNFRSLSTAGIQDMLHAAEEAMRVGGTADIPPPG
jgi:thiol-disulfide isomerase/thioredoxin